MVLDDVATKARVQGRKAKREALEFWQGKLLNLAKSFCDPCANAELRRISSIRAKEISVIKQAARGNEPSGCLGVFTAQI